VLDACAGGQLLLLSDGDGLALRCRRGGHLVRRLMGGDRDVTLSPDGRLLTGLTGGEVTLKDLVTERVLARLRAGQPGEEITQWTITAGGRYLATASAAGVVTVWDLALLQGGAAPAAVPPSPAEAGRLWLDLGSEDPGVAYRAVWRLAAASGHAVALLRERLPPARPSGQVEALVADLNSKEFARRQQAARQLRELDGALPLLRRLAGEGPLERRRRLGEIVRDLEQLRLTAAQRRVYRAVQTLECLATGDAHGLLREWARGDPEALQTRQAEAALRRLARPPQGYPERR
jgi:hypothetical protein